MICETSPKSRTGQRSLRRPVKTTERRHAGRPRRLTRQSMLNSSLGWEIGSPLADPVRHRIGHPERYHPRVPIPRPSAARTRPGLPSRKRRLRLNEPVARGQLVEHDALNGKRVRSRWVDQDAAAPSANAVLAATSRVTGTGRAPSCQICSESRPVKASSARRPSEALQQNDRHLRLFVGGERPRRSLPILVAVATTGTRSRSPHRDATARR